MATALQSLRIAARCCSCRSSAMRNTSKPIVRHRQFSGTPKQYANQINPKFVELRDKLVELEKNVMEAEDFNEQMDEELEDAGSRHSAYLPPYGFDEGVRRKLKPSFLNMGEPDPFDEEERQDDDDDISTLGHMELEQVREMRHYARLAAWEMPMLSKLAKPFEPPTARTPLRFRYTTYMGEQHPAEKKVVLEFCPGDMPGLTEVQTDKLRKLAGPRLNPETDIIKMSCEMHPSQAQNKRHLGDLVDSLLAESKSGDDFADVPLDTRHHVFKIKPKFPVEWRMSEDRRRELGTYRLRAAEFDSRKSLEGKLVDGVKHIEIAMARAPTATEPLLETVPAGGKKVAMKRRA